MLLFLNNKRVKLICMAAGLAVIAGLFILFMTTAVRADQFENRIADHEEIYNGQNGWWYHDASGNIDPSVTTVACNAYGWWYVENGKVNFDYTGIKSNENGWWRIVNGQVDFSADGIYQNEYGWWYCQGGRVNFDYTGIRHNENGWWRIVNGQVDFSADGIYQNEYGWWYCQGGRVNFEYTGLQPNERGWWYINNGAVDFDFYGFAQNEYGFWYCKGGKVDFEYSAENADIKRIIVGNSRVACMCESSDDPTTRHICKSGMEYDYFISTEVPELEQALQLLPNIQSVVISMGVNDILNDAAHDAAAAENWAEKYAEVINGLVVKYPNVRFYFASLYYIDGFESDDGYKSAQDYNPCIDAFNKAMKHECNVMYIPLREYVSVNNITTDDGIHIIERSRMLQDYIIRITG